MTPIEQTNATDSWVSDVADLLGDLLTIHRNGDMRSHIDGGLRFRFRAERLLKAIGVDPYNARTQREAEQMRQEARNYRGNADQLERAADEFIAFREQTRVFDGTSRAEEDVSTYKNCVARTIK